MIQSQQDEEGFAPGSSIQNLDSITQLQCASPQQNRATARESLFGKELRLPSLCRAGVDLLGGPCLTFLAALTPQMQTINLLNRLQMSFTYLLTLPEVPGSADNIIFIAATKNNEFLLFQESDCNCSRRAGRCAFHRQPS